MMWLDKFWLNNPIVRYGVQEELEYSKIKKPTQRDKI